MPVSEEDKGKLSTKRGAAAQYVPADKQQDFREAQGKVDEDYQKGKYKNKQGTYEDTLRDLDKEADSYLPADKNPGKSVPPPVFHKGTDYVAKTGPAILKKGEAVLKKEDADKYRAKQGVFGDLQDELGDGKPEKPAKEIDHIKTRKAKSGGYIHEHHHTHPEQYPKEDHISGDQSAMIAHMLTHLGDSSGGGTDDAGAPAA